MFDPRPVLFICGILLTALAGAMVIPALADIARDDIDWQPFLRSAAFTFFVGGGLILTTRTRREAMRLNLRQAFLFTTLSWLVIATFAALPFYFSRLDVSYTDAFFESMSGITTTGATVIEGLDTAPPGILLWRAMLQWLGGVGIIVVAVAILPMLRIGGMQLFRMESSDRSEKIMPRAAQVTASIGALYLALSVACVLAYWSAGMTFFDAVAHAMTTIATGGFSTHDDSLGYFGIPAVEWIAVVFMLLGAMPFVLYLQALRGRPRALFRDTQVWWFLTIVAIGILALTTWQLAGMPAETDVWVALRRAAFNVTAIITGTGYATTAYDLWGGFAIAAFFLFMFIGGCAGSTSCGIKVFRFQVLYATARAQMLRLMQPHGVFIPYYNRRPIGEDVTTSVMGFFFLFVMAFGVLSMMLGAMGLDFLTSISGAASAIANVGPGLGEMIGPSGTYAGLPDPAKWMLAAGMLLGRLELFTVLILFAPSFWRG